MGQERRLDREEGGLRDLKENVVNKYKCTMERAYKGGGWLTILSRS